MDFTKRHAYLKLQRYAENPPDMTKPYTMDAKRIQAHTCNALNLKMMYATERVDEQIMSSLSELAVESNCLKEMRMIQDMEVMNIVANVPKCEMRRVGHHAIRKRSLPKDAPEPVQQAHAAYQAELKKLRDFLRKIKNFKVMVVIGIGGSALGAHAVSQALDPLNTSGREVIFSANMDPDRLAWCLREVDLNETLFCVISKSGGTLEIKYQEELLRNKLKDAGLDARERIVMVTGEKSPMDKPENYREIFYMWDYIGGRYSVCSMVGAVPLAFKYGMEMWEQFLAGMADMDEHARTMDNPLANLPLLGALLGVWNRNFLDCHEYLVLPYIQSMDLWADHLQQLFMESNGKRINKRTGQMVDHETVPVVAGNVGTSSQHSFFQMLHQGTSVPAMEFIGFKNAQFPGDMVLGGTTNHEKLLSNLIAQSLSLATGQHNANLNQFFPGNRPNHMILGANLDPYTLGNLLAYQECYVEFQGIIWDINSFDQEGVQLGKVVANKIIDQYMERREKGVTKASDELEAAVTYMEEMDKLDGGLGFNETRKRAV